MMFDMHTVMQMLLIAVIGALVGLDRTAVGQFMISQPIVAAPLAGWVLGDAAAGLVIGAVLELIWVLDMPIGTFVPADSTVAAVSASAIAALGSRGGTASLDLIGYSLLLTTGMAPVSMAADGFIRKHNVRLAERAVEAPEGDLEARLTRTHLAGIGVFFLKSFILYLLFVPLGLAAVLAFNALPEKIHTAMALFVKLLPLLGAALMVRKLSIRALDGFVLAGFAAAVVASLLFHPHPAAVVCIAAAGGWLGASYRERRRA